MYVPIHVATFPETGRMTGGAARLAVAAAARTIFERKIAALAERYGSRTNLLEDVPKDWDVFWVFVRCLSPTVASNLGLALARINMEGAFGTPCNLRNPQLRVVVA